jgi:hypothetical protein
MTPDRFERLAAAYGADIERWPQDLRAPAYRLARLDPTAAHQLRMARALDRTLDRASAVTVPPVLRDRVLRAAPAPRRLRARWDWLGAASLAAGLAAAGAACVVAGIIAGGVAVTNAHGPPTTDPAEEAALQLREPVDLAEG